MDEKAITKERTVVALSGQRCSYGFTHGADPWADLAPAKECDRAPAKFVSGWSLSHDDALFCAHHAKIVARWLRLQLFADPTIEIQDL